MAQELKALPGEAGEDPMRRPWRKYALRRYHRTREALEAERLRTLEKLELIDELLAGHRLKTPLA